MVATSLRDIPVEIEEAARIDGCSDLGIIWRIILPIAAPGIVTAAIFAFVLSWAESIFSHWLYTTSERAQTAPVLVFYLLGQHQIDYARLMSARRSPQHPHRSCRSRSSSASTAAGLTEGWHQGLGHMSIETFIREQPETIARCVAAAENFAATWRPSATGIALVGSGSSFNALTAARPSFVAARRRGPVVVL